MIRCKKVWKNWGLVRSVVRSPHTFVMTTTILIYWERVLSEYNVFGYILRARKGFPLSWKKRLSRCSMLVHVSGAQCFLWRTKKFVFLEVWSMNLFFWRDEKINSSWYWSCVWSKMLKPKVCFPFNQQNIQFLSLQKSAKPGLTCRIILLTNIDRQLYCLRWWYTLLRKENDSWLRKKKTISSSEDIFCANHNHAHSNLNQKSQKSFHLWHNLVESPSADTDIKKIICILILTTFSLQ